MCLIICSVQCAEESKECARQKMCPSSSTASADCLSDESALHFTLAGGLFFPCLSIYFFLSVKPPAAADYDCRFAAIELLPVCFVVADNYFQSQIVGS